MVEVLKFIRMEINMKVSISLENFMDTELTLGSMEQLILEILKKERKTEVENGYILSLELV